MHWNILFLSFLLSIGGCSNVDVAVPSREPSAIEKKDSVDSHEWKPAEFKGLKMGSSSREELITALGNPVSTNFEPKQENPRTAAHQEIVDEFDLSGDDITGTLTAYSNRADGILNSINIAPERLTFDALLDRYGSHYKVTKYRFVGCPGDSDSALIAEDPNGSVEYVEFRDKGLAVSLEGNPKIVSTIQLLSKGMGTDGSHCGKK